MKIVIIGSGMMGSAMAVPALENGHSVVLVGTPLDNDIIDGLKTNGYHKTLKRKLVGDIAFKQYDDISEKIPNCDILVCGVSSFGAEWFAENVIPNLKSGQKVLAITKGLHKQEDGKLIPFPIWFANLRSDIYFNAVGGPCISFELAVKIHTEVAFCGKDKEILSILRNAFATNYYHISITNDINGIDVTAALLILAKIGDCPNKTFKTSKHLCSWAGLSQRNDESAGKIKSKMIMPGNPYVKSILCQVAWVAVKKRKNPLGNWFWFHQAKLGKKKAIIAVSRKILTLSYALISNNTFYDNNYLSARLNE